MGYRRRGPNVSGVLCFQAIGGVNASVTVTISPISISNSGTPSFKTFASCTVTVTGGTVSSYTWSNGNPQYGTWTVDSGQGTATAAAKVTNVIGHETATCDWTCTVIVAGATYVITAPLSYYNSSAAP